MTSAQLATLATDISNNNNLIGGVAIKDLPHTPDNAFAVAAWYSDIVNPPFIVWRTDINTEEINESVDWTEVVALVTNSLLAFQILKDQARINAANASIRSAFTTIFPSATKPNSNAGLIAVAKRSARFIEKLFATGTGTTGSPAIMTYEGILSNSDIRACWGI